MDEKGALGSSVITSEEKNDSLCSMFFGVSCAFFALRLLSKPEIDEERWSVVRDRLLRGSSHLLGLLVWRVQKEVAGGAKCELLYKLENAKREIEELKGRRREDAKANEKVLGMFANQEQSWISERKKLRQQIGALLNELRVVQKKNNEAIAEMNGKLEEKELCLQSKDKVLDEEKQNRTEVENRLKAAKALVEELRETSRRKAQEHSTEIWKHKTAFIELVSNQRQLEAEMGRALRQAETAKQDLDSVVQRKEESILMVQKLSMELVKIRKDLEQKDNILSTMLRKSKLDTAEKQMLLKEVKMSKAKRKQAEQETERWKAVSGARSESHSLRSMLSKHVSRFDVSSDEKGGQSQSTDFLLNYEPDHEKETDVLSPIRLQEGSEQIVFAADVERLEGWVRFEAEKYITVIEQQHRLEIDAFAEQLRLKDEKLEACRWRLLSMELESKRLQSHMEGLNYDLLQLRQDNMKLEASLLDREAELNSVKKQLALHLDPRNHHTPDPALSQETVWSNVKVIKRNVVDKEQDRKVNLLDLSKDVEPLKEEEMRVAAKPKEIVLMTVQSPGKEFEEEEDAFDPAPIQQEEVKFADKIASSSEHPTNSLSSSWKMDLHALGVSYKIKRLKHQLCVLERLTAEQECCGDGENDENARSVTMELQTLISWLSKQANRYLSLQGKIDELRERMRGNDVDSSRRDSSVARSKEETKSLEHFLEETFQLQRYIVSRGQRLMEIQSKIGSAFVGTAGELDGANGFDTKRVAENVRTLFREVQRGLEVRISRIIGDLEGTLARDGIMHMRT